jgi:hypothetical protein
MATTGQTQASKDAAEQNAEAKDDKAAAEELPADQQVIGLSKHLTSWRESYGDDVVDAALELSAKQRKATASERDEAEKADAARSRAFAGQSSSVPEGRSANNPKSTTA